MKDGELPAVETCTLEEGEEDEEVRLMFVQTVIMQYRGCPKKVSHFQMQITPEIFSLKIQFRYF